MKRLLVLLVVVLMSTLILSSCGYSEAELSEAHNAGYDEGYALGYDEGYNAGYDEGWADALAMPEGSVVAKNIISNFLVGQVEVIISALVMNVGGDGAITVKASFRLEDWDEPQSKTTKIYLNQGEEHWLNFSFFVETDADIVDFWYNVWCIED